MAKDDKGAKESSVHICGWDKLYAKQADGFEFVNLLTWVGDGRVDTDCVVEKAPVIDIARYYFPDQICGQSWSRRDGVRFHLLMAASFPFSLPVLWSVVFWGRKGVKRGKWFRVSCWDGWSIRCVSCYTLGMQRKTPKSKPDVGHTSSSSFDNMVGTLERFLLLNCAKTEWILAYLLARESQRSAILLVLKSALESYPSKERVLVWYIHYVNSYCMIMTIVCTSHQFLQFARATM
jgi:hypothetical protein